MVCTGPAAVVAAVAGAVTVVCAVAYAGRERSVIVRPSPPVVHQVVPAVNLFERLGHTAAEEALASAGVVRRSSGGCADPARKECTSYAGLRRGTLEGLVRFARESRCPVTVSGGTETGGADTARRPMMYGHANGYKVDIMPTRCVDHYIHATMTRVATRRDRSPMYQGARRNELYVDERRRRWDVFYGPQWCVDKLIRLRRARCE